MANIIQNPVVLNEDDLLTPLAAQKYKLGTVITVEGPSDNAVKQFMYVKSHGSLTAGVPYVVKRSATAGSEYITAAPATNTNLKNLVCVPAVGFTSGDYGFVQISGKATLVTTSATYAAGDALEVLNGDTKFVLDGAAAGANYFSTNTIAVVTTGGSSATRVTALLLGLEKAIQAS